MHLDCFCNNKRLFFFLRKGTEENRREGKMEGRNRKETGRIVEEKGMEEGREKKEGKEEGREGRKEGGRGRKRRKDRHSFIIQTGVQISTALFKRCVTMGK